jgi:TniQ
LVEQAASPVVLAGWPNPTRIWPFHPREQDDEQALSLLARFAADYRMPFSTFAAGMLNIGWPERQRVKRPFSDIEVRRIAEALSRGTGLGRSRFYRTFAPEILAAGPIAADRDWFWPRSLLDKPMVHCPLCLAEDERPYLRRGWSFRFAVVCPAHETRLADRCGHCGRRLRLGRYLDRGRFDRCSECDHALTVDRRRANRTVVLLSQAIAAGFKTGRVTFGDVANVPLARFLELLRVSVLTATPWPQAYFPALSLQGRYHLLRKVADGLFDLGSIRCQIAEGRRRLLAAETDKAFIRAQAATWTWCRLALALAPYVRPHAEGAATPVRDEAPPLHDLSRQVLEVFFAGQQAREVFAREAASRAEHERQEATRRKERAKLAAALERHVDWHTGEMWQIPSIEDFPRRVAELGLFWQWQASRKAAADKEALRRHEESTRRVAALLRELDPRMRSPTST